ncbi:peptidylprolyl isomerase [Pseudoalteromonas denitrificans]|uniref:Peptidyl-prolyl cis-trans isomerase n=1 Tax=Pseudoalteromonas denitrificans DSM 6059 TaxID=1123010 RepID=A0A1I1KL31_9GAMM|nr:peptidylprolyl isomerase [Pseudoalteromonas denitrificans]SFC61381.1 peptidyl-prolyl cis-trans isomerase B (cyclophilin B) [Pseudoalteromonas denitrificans DSM 6059]
MITFKTNMGDIQIALDYENTPISARNFLKYCKEGFYEGTIFHRVIKGFMIQGGGMLPDMTEKEGHDVIVNEANRGGKNVEGTLAMARTMSPHSASCQFFINVRDNSFLDFTAKTNDGWGYAVFGKVTQGMEIVKKIEKVKTRSYGEHDDVPKMAVIVEKVIVAE